MDYKNVLEQLTSELDAAAKSAFKKNAVLKCAELAKKLEAEFPKSMREADSILTNQNALIGGAKSESEKILAAARDEAERIAAAADAEADKILDKARAEAGTLIAQSTIVKRAEETAAAMCQTATAESGRVASQSYNAMVSLFSNAENTFVKLYKQLEDARNLIMGAFNEGQ
ncbi:MAG: hypothetical protein FWE62_00420 [Firmicutes bacterium]|nr:hypothetical protein [Bacillota bacterium]